MMVAPLTIWITYKIKQSADIQYISTLITSFQDEWHSRISLLMRAALQTDEFKNAIDTGIEKAYGQRIEYKDFDNLIDKLLDPQNLKGNIPNDVRLESFHEELMNIVFSDTVNKGIKLFTGYEAIYRVLLCFDRCAVIRNEPQAIKKFIRKYRPPLRDFAGIMQTFISIRIVLSNEDKRNYKKDYMQLLRMLGIANEKLYEECKAKLKTDPRKEWKFTDSIRAEIIRLLYRFNYY